MSRYGVASSQRDVAAAHPWRNFALCVSVGIFLLLLEQAKVGLWLWDLARWSALPGLHTVTFLQRTVDHGESWWNWRGFVAGRLADSEHQVQVLSQRNAELTLQLQQIGSDSGIESSESPAVAHSAPRLAFQPDTSWKSAVWQGIPGAWQVALGCSSGVEPGSPVVTPEGIFLGVVSESKTKYSKVQVWDDAEFALPVRVGTSSAVALLRGGRDKIQIQSLRWPSAVVQGDAVLTAGSEGVPRDLRLGTVIHLEPQPQFAEATAELAPIVKLEQQRDVLVRTNALSEGDPCQL